MEEREAEQERARLAKCTTEFKARAADQFKAGGQGGLSMLMLLTAMFTTCLC